MVQPANQRFAVAVHLLTMLAESPDQVLDSRVLAESPATNPAHVRRILGMLRDEGLVVSRAGAHGGWMLSRPPGDIDLAAVWSAVNGDDPLLGVHQGDPGCPVGRRVTGNLRTLDAQLRSAVLADLATSTVADMLSTTP